MRRCVFIEIPTISIYSIIFRNPWRTSRFNLNRQVFTNFYQVIQLVDKYGLVVINRMRCIIVVTLSSHICLREALAHLKIKYSQLQLIQLGAHHQYTLEKVSASWRRFQIHISFWTPFNSYGNVIGIRKVSYFH